MNFHLFPAIRGNVEIFDEFFSSNMDETISPFLTPSSRRWGKHLPLKATLIAAFFLILSFILSNPSLVAICLLFSYFFAGTHALIAAIDDLLNLEINIDILMTLSAFLSFLIGSGKEGALLLVLFALSGAIDERVRKKANHNLRALKALAPTKAYVLQKDQSLALYSVRAIKPGDQIYIRAGDIIPLDGEVVSGASSINLVHLTGENQPQSVDAGSEVFSGSTNIDGPLVVKVSHTSSDSTIARIIQMVAAAREMKPRMARFIDTFSSRYAKGVILFAFLFALAAPLVFQMDYLGPEGSFYRAIAVLIAASPCALVIAIPISYLSSIGACAKQGILLKGGSVLDALLKCRIFAFDKTGTLTEGNLRLTQVDAFGQTYDETQIFALASALERGAHHPIAEAICRAATDKKIAPLPLEEHKMVAGYGMQAQFEDKRLSIGNRAWILPKLTRPPANEILQKLDEVEKNGEVHTLFLFEDRLYLFTFEDIVREGIQKTLTTLKDRYGLELVMLTGDHEASAQRIAQQVGLTRYFSNLRPADKLDHITELAKKENLVMVGDGINDAPALARATVGISMGKEGAQSAIDASDVVLLQDRVDQLGWLLEKAHRTGHIVRQNIGLSLLAITFASTAALAGFIPLWLAVILHEGSTVIVALNALRLLKR